MTMFQFSRRRLTVFLLGLVALSAVVLSLATRDSADAQKARPQVIRAAAAPSTNVAADDPVLQKLAQDSPKLDLDRAVLVLDDAAGKAWATTAADGQVCVIERPAVTTGTAPVVTSRFGCRDAKVAAEEGVVAGVPGHWIGLAPSAAVKVSSGSLQPQSGAVRVDPAAKSVTLDGHTTALAAAPQTR